MGINRGCVRTHSAFPPVTFWFALSCIALMFVAHMFGRIVSSQDPRLLGSSIDRAQRSVQMLANIVPGNDGYSRSLGVIPGRMSGKWGGEPCVSYFGVFRFRRRRPPSGSFRTMFGRLTNRGASQNGPSQSEGKAPAELAVPALLCARF